MIDTQEHIDAIYKASDLVTRNAESLRDCHTSNQERDDWCGDDDVRLQYEDEIMIASFAEKAAEFLIDLHTERDALLAALRDLVEEKQPLGILRPAY